MFFLFKYVFLVYIGSVVLNVIYIEYQVDVGLYLRKDLLLNLWVYSSLGLFLIPLGMQCTNLLLRYDSRMHMKDFRSRGIDFTAVDLNNILLGIYILVFTFCLSIFLIYREKIGGFPIESLGQGYSSTELGFLRSESNNNFKGRYWLYMLFIQLLPLSLLVVSFFLKKISLKYSIFFYILLFYSVFVAIMDFQKAPLIEVIFLLLAAKLFRDGVIKRSLIIYTGSVSLVLLGLMYVFFMNVSAHSYVRILLLPIERIIVGNIAPFYWWQLFQEQSGWLYGESFPNLMGMLPFEPRRVTVEILEFVRGNENDGGAVGSMPTVFFGSWFINFGIIGMLFSMVLLGFIMQVLDVFFIKALKKKKSIYLAVPFILTAFYFSHFSQSNFEAFFISPGFYLPIFFMFVIYVVKNSLIKKHCS